MARKYQDFRNVNDYRLAVKILRKFARDRFSVAAGYNLRHFRELSDIPKKQAAEIRRYYREMRPLLVYGYQARKAKSKADLKEKYGALYGIKPLPGIDRIPIPLNASTGKADKVKFIKDRDTGKMVASVQVSPGIYMIRYTWEDLGYSWDDLTNDHAAVLREVTERFRPDYIGLIAGISRVKREGRIDIRTTWQDAAQRMAHLMTRYGAGSEKAEQGHNIEDWLDGLELYFFRPPVKGTLNRRAQIKPWLDDEQKRWKERNKLSKQIKNKSAYINKLKRQVENWGKLIKKLATKSDANRLMQGIAGIEKQIARAEKERDKLITRLHLTKGF